MSHTDTHIAVGAVRSLAVNGHQEHVVTFDSEGPQGDRHSGFTRKLSGHDTVYLETSTLSRGDTVFNWRSWTGLSAEEIEEIQSTLGVRIPVGCLLENITFSGIPDFSQLATGTRLVFPARKKNTKTMQVILAVWEENGPCKTVGDRLESHYKIEGISARFVRAAHKRRGVMGFVLSPGFVIAGDEVRVYPPV